MRSLSRRREASQVTAPLEDELYAVLQAIGHAGSPHTISVHCITSGQLYERPEVPIAHDVHLTYERALQLPVVQSQLRQVGQQDLL